LFKIYKRQGKTVFIKQSNLPIIIDCDIFSLSGNKIKAFIIIIISIALE